ncbi:MAG: hypothetical protein WBI99_06720 [Limnochordia bacterium]|jgi:hypothetical protein|nr:hypothetical protein [Limnochordia bacterium]MDI9463977.1 hypothetical protein [Bacillota bacterium]NLO95800.1 hypothetical protein [Bacillota bacterium]HAN94078.1 hypothetical protein [Bacillota bacterium]HOB40736.1 hypothetical protein [Limnochordia bacterium]
MRRTLVVALVLVSLLALAGSSLAAEIKLGKADFAAHGTKCFTVAVVALQGDTIVAAYIDEYQMLSKSETIGVPNADPTFTIGETWLASKKVNNDFYSNNMARAGSTVTIANNFKAIEEFVVGMTISELEAFLASAEPAEFVDMVTGATLVDNYGYLSALLAAAKDALNN